MNSKGSNLASHQISKQCCKHLRRCGEHIHVSLKSYEKSLMCAFFLGKESKFCIYCQDFSDWKKLSITLHGFFSFLPPLAFFMSLFKYLPFLGAQILLFSYHFSLYYEISIFYESKGHCLLCSISLGLSDIKSLKTKDKSLKSCILEA